MSEKLMIQSIVTDNRITAKFSDKFLPLNAVHGELYIVGGILYIFVDLDGTDQGKWFPLTDKKEIYTFEQETLSLRWVIPTTFNTENIQIIIYDNYGRVYDKEFNMINGSDTIELDFTSPLSGQCYIIVNKTFSWVDKEFIVGDNQFVISEDANTPGKYYIEIDTEFVKINRDGTVVFSKDLLIAGNLDVGGNTHISGNLVVDGDNVVINTKTLTVEDNIITLNSGISSPLLDSGIEIDRGSEGILKLITFDEMDLKVNIPVLQSDNTILQDEIAGKTFTLNEIMLEKNRAEAIENTLTSNLNVEINRAKATEGILNQLDTVEQGNLVASINEVHADIDTEQARAEASELVLTNDLSTEILDRTNAIDAESTARLSADNTLTTNLSNEVTRASNAESILQTNIDTEANVRAAVDNTLTTNLSNEVTRASDAEAVLTSNLDNETTARINSDNTLQTKIDIETSRIDSILSLSTTDKDSFAEIVTLINSVDTTNDDALAGYITNNNARSTLIETNLSNEISARINADNVLTTNLSNETTRASDAEGVLTTNIVNEITNRINADNVLTTNLSNEVTRASDAEGILTTAIDTETSARINADNVLTTNLSNETTRASDAEGVLGSRVTSLESAVGANIGDLTTLTTDTKSNLVLAINEVDLNTNTQTTNLSTETTNRTNADSILQTNINTVANDRYTKSETNDNFIATTGGTINGDLTINGTLSATDLVETSSKRFKENVKSIENAFETVSQLQGVTYDWIESGKADIGFIAEDVEKVIPELVKKTNGVVDGMNYGKLTSMLVEVVKSQQTQIDELKANVEFLLRK